MTKQIFLSVLVTLSFLFSTNNLQAQLNVPSEVCGRYAELDYSGTIPTGATAYWIDSLNVVVNWWQDINNTVGNGAQTIAEVGQYGQNAFAFVIQDGANYDTSAWSTVTFNQQPQVDACPSCYRLEDADVDFENGDMVHVGSVRTDTICLLDNNSFYLLNPSYNLGQPQWSKNLNGIIFANEGPPVYNHSYEPNDTVFVDIYNSMVGNPGTNYYVLVFKSENGNGCADSDTLLVSFAKQPSGIINYRRPYCHGQEAEVWAFNDYKANPTEFNWDFGSNANVLYAVADANTPDSIYSVNWGTNNDCNNLNHQVSLTASSSWGCTSSLNISYIEEPPLVMPVINSIQPSCGLANGIIHIVNDSAVTCTDTVNYIIYQRWFNSTVYDFMDQTDNGLNAVVDSLYHVSYQDTTWIELTYTSLITLDSNWVGAQVQCKDTIEVVLEDGISTFINGTIDNYNDIPTSMLNTELFDISNGQFVNSSIVNSQGEYSIGFVNGGDYNLKLNILEPSIASPYISTYYTNQYLWNNTPTTITLACGDVVTANFSALNYTSINAGSGYINGNINYINTSNVYVGASVFLIDSTDNSIVSYAITDLTGQFEFFNVNNGSYYLNVDIFGLPQNSTHNFAISASNLVLGNLNFTVDTVIGTKTTNSTFGITANYESVNVNEISNESSFVIYPNPAKDYIQIQSDKSINNIEILSIDGKMVKQITNSNNSFNISGLDNGIYFVKSENTIRKFIKK